MRNQRLRISVAMFLVIGAVHTQASGQRNRRCPPRCTPQTIVSAAPQMRLTYGGKIYFDFGSYTVAASGTPAIPGSSPFPTTRVIVNDGRGMYWDGGSYFIHPAYRYDLVSKHYFTERTIGTLGSSNSIATYRTVSPPSAMPAPVVNHARPQSSTFRYLPPPMPPKLIEKQRETSNRNTATSKTKAQAGSAKFAPSNK